MADYKLSKIISDKIDRHVEQGFSLFDSVDKIRSEFKGYFDIKLEEQKGKEEDEWLRIHLESIQKTWKNPQKRAKLKEKIQELVQNMDT